MSWWEDLDPAKVQWLKPDNAWHRIVHTLEWFDDTEDDDVHQVALDEATVMTSQVRGTAADVGGGMHKLLIHLDVPTVLVASAKPGHFHLYIDHEIPWATYKSILHALMAAGVVRPEFVDASLECGFTALPTPWAYQGQP